VDAAVTLLRWEDGRIRLPNDAILEVAVRGRGAVVSFEDGALTLRRGAGFAGDEDGDDTIEVSVRHPFTAPTHLWVPHLTPDPGDVIGDAVFRSPAIVISHGGIALALVPDLDDVARAVGWRAWLDYDHPRGEITLGVGAYRAKGHVFYVRERAHFEDANVSLRWHVLASTSPDDCANPYGLAARWLWERWGRGSLARTPPPPLPRLVDHVVNWAFLSGWAESVWQPVELADGTRAGGPVFIVDVARHPSVPAEHRTWREPRSIWNQAWFSTQRCANGLLRHARRAADAELERRAKQMTRIALAAPQQDGLFPAVLVADGAGTWRWSNSDRRPPSVSAEACHLVDAAFTCRMLLEWESLTGDPEPLAYVRRFADRLVELQRPSGAFPGWIEPDGRVAAALAEGPESAVSATLLFELAERLSEKSEESAAWRESALAALDFLEGVAGEGRWEDFETYYSCARWGAPEQLGRRVPRNGVFKQNTLSIAWSAEAFLKAFRVTQRRRHLDVGRRCLDELSLYQAVWDPPFLPARAHGGFGVMNADSEWNDARQSLFAPLYLDFGREMADRELTERGVSALRASFSMLYCPEHPELARAYERRFPFFGPETYGFMMENQGHGNADPIGTFTIFTWGNGSAVAAAATVADRFPEVARDCGLE
jgi:hypothetical protein